MKNLFWKLHRKLRGRIHRYFGDDLFKQTIIQNLLGFKIDIDNQRILETIDGLEIEYCYSSVIGKQLFFQGSFEENEIIFLSKILLEDSAPIVLDIGANIGLHSMKLARSGKNTKIYAFEPSPGTASILRKNIIKNSLANKVIVVPKAVSDKICSITFFECEDNAYSSLKDTKRKKVVNRVKVPVTTIDEFVKENEISKISLIKIDVEGLETEVIKGAENVLNNLKPDLFVEIYGGENSNLNPEQTIESILSYGYKAFVFNSIKASLEPFEKHSDEYYNYYFIHVDREYHDRNCKTLVEPIELTE